MQNKKVPYQKLLNKTLRRYLAYLSVTKAVPLWTLISFTIYHLDWI